MGQLERGDSGYEHWQFVLSYAQKKSLSYVKATLCPTAHVEATRSAAAIEYVCKESTRIEPPFEFGRRAFNRNLASDWDRIRVLAVTGDFEAIPSDIFIRHYGALKKIHQDAVQPIAIERSAVVYWGATGVGKSRRAWGEASSDAYPKDPRTKFWCGYHGEQHVVIDEFRGGIDISHLLRWLDRYPVRVEIKGSSQPLLATKYWITSNLHPDQWYLDIDQATKLALKRRLTIVQLE